VSPRLPAEWEPQRAVIITWPHGTGDWGPTLAAVEASYDVLATAIARHEPLVVACADTRHEAHIRRRLADHGAALENIHFHAVTTTDTWVRDYGPLTVHTPDGPALLDFIFDGWNGRFEATLDDAATATLHARGALGPLPLHRRRVILEGGALDTDGEGLLLTTPRCLLGRRNGLDRAGYEALFEEELGVSRVLWLEHGALAGDDTDGHVDMLARFCPGGVIAHTAPATAGDPDAAALEAMAGELAAMVDSTPRLKGLVPLPRPAPRRDADGDFLPASYANFLVINGAVLMPEYDDPADGAAREAITGCFPGRTVVGIPAIALIEQHGSVHCATMHLPV